MDEPIDALLPLLPRLEAAGVPYMIVGGLAAIIWGIHRTTADIDIAVQIDPERLDALVAALPEGWYASRIAGLEAIRRCGMFNIIDPFSGYKIDLYVNRSSPYDAEAFARRVTRELRGIDLCLSSPEDTLLAKLRWSKQSSSSLQMNDAVGLAAMRWSDLDRGYMEKWAAELGIHHMLRKCLETAERLQ